MADTALSADTGFTRTLAGRTEAVLNTERPSSGIKPFTPSPDNDDVDVFDSVSAAFTSSGVVTGGVKALASRPVIRRPDPAYDLDRDLQSRPEDLKLVQEFLDNPDDPASGAVLALLTDAQNADQTRAILDRVRESRENMRIASANGIIPELIGMTGGIGLDIAALWGMSLLTGGTGALGVLTARGAATGRALAATRLGALGAAEGAAERSAQSLTNPLITNRDVLEAAGFGGGASALLGFAFPTLLGNVRRLSDDVDNLKPLNDALIDEAREVSGRSVGAASAVEPRVTNVPARGSGSIAAKRVLPKATQESILRNPKRVIIDMGVQGAKDFTERGLTGARQFFDVMSRSVRLSTVMEGEVGGVVARAASVQDVRDQFRAVRLARQAEAAREYNKFMKDAFAVGGVRLALRNNALKSFEKHLISQEQYEAMADEYAIASGAGVLDEVQIIPREIDARLTPEQRNMLMESLKTSAAREDEFYQRFGQIELKHGLIQEKDLIPGYRPQRWNRDEIAKDPQGFQQFLLESFAKQPDENWIVANYGLRKEDGTFEPVLKDGETFADLSKRDPELANEILDDWSASLREEAANQKLLIARLKDRELARLRGTSLAQIEERATVKLREARRTLQKAEAQLKALPADASTGDRSRLATRIAKIEKRIADEDEKLTTLRTLDAADQSLSDTFPVVMGRAVSGDSADAAIKKFGTSRQKQQLNKLTRVARKAAQREAQTAARKLVREQIEEIRRAILNNDSPFAFVDQEFIQSSSRFKRRNIHLGKHRFREPARRFLLTSTHDARAAYDASVSVQLAMREVFSPILEREGADFSLDRVRDMALKGFDDDLQKTTDVKVRGRIAKDRERAKKIFDHIFEEMTSADVTNLRGIRKGVNNLTSIVNTASAAMSLGGVVLAQLGDLAVQVMAGGKIGTGFRAMWRRGVVKHIREIATDENELAVLIQGPSVLDASRFRALAEIDNLDFDVPGGTFRRVLRSTNEVAKIEGWANLMHVWNTIVRGGFGLDFARQIDEDMARWSSLPAHLKTYYARLGITQEDAADIAVLMNKAHRKAVNGKLRIPHSAKWAEQRPDLLTKYQVAIKAAGDEAMIDPSVGDRPFLRSFPGGRIVLQFQSFMYTAGERFVGPLIQELQLHPTSTRPYFAALAGVFLGAMTDGLKAAARGEFEEWANRWDDQDAWKDNLWGAMLRSPMMVGPSSTLTDVAMSMFGRVANDRLQDLANVRPFREEATRFRENQGAFALLGPATGTLAGTVPSLVRRYLDGDIEEATGMLSRRIPILNVFYLHMLARLAEKE